MPDLLFLSGDRSLLCIMPSIRSLGNKWPNTYWIFSLNIHFPLSKKREQFSIKVVVLDFSHFMRAARNYVHISHSSLIKLLFLRIMAFINLTVTLTVFIFTQPSLSSDSTPRLFSGSHFSSLLSL